MLLSIAIIIHTQDSCELTIYTGSLQPPQPYCVTFWSQRRCPRPRIVLRFPRLHHLLLHHCSPLLRPQGCSGITPQRPRSSRSFSLLSWLVRVLVRWHIQWHLGLCLNLDVVLWLGSGLDIKYHTSAYEWRFWGYDQRYSERIMT